MDIALSYQSSGTASGTRPQPDRKGLEQHCSAIHLIAHSMKVFGCNQLKTLPQARDSPVKHLSEASEFCSVRRATKRAKRQRYSDVYRRANEDRYHRQVCKAEMNETSETAAEDTRDDNRLQQAVLQRNFPVSGMRPWSFLIPTLDEVATSKDWHLKVLHFPLQINSNAVVIFFHAL